MEPIYPSLFYPGDINEKRLEKILTVFDNYFLENLSRRLEMSDYAKKIAIHGFSWVLYDSTGDVGHAGFYVRGRERDIFLTNILVKQDYRGKKLGNFLLSLVESFAIYHNKNKISLQYDTNSLYLKKFYERRGFRNWDKGKNECFKVLCPR